MLMEVGSSGKCDSGDIFLPLHPFQTASFSFPRSFLLLTAATLPQKQVTMAVEPKFEGWLGKGPESAKGKMEWGAFANPKKWTEDDVDIQIAGISRVVGAVGYKEGVWFALTSVACCVIVFKFTTGTALCVPARPRLWHRKAS